MVKRLKEIFIQSWIKRICNSSLNIKEYFSRYNVPFSQAQYYRYKKGLEREGIKSLKDKRTQGNNRKIISKIEEFIKGYIAGHPDAKLFEIKEIIKKEFHIEITESGISRWLKRIGKARKSKPHKEKTVQYYTVCGGFELIVALACQIGWPRFVSNIIKQRIEQIKRSEYWENVDIRKECFGRNEQGQFTSEYNKRLDVRKKRFDSIENKRKYKNFRGMSISSVSSNVIERKNLAMLTLPIITNNGMIRSVNMPMGNTLGNFCGYNYKQATLNKFLSEMKYLGIAEGLLRQQVKFWQKFWKLQPQYKIELPILCYYIDGNTKAFWSTKHVKKNRVSMLGRIMGCIEMVFVNDNFGHPIYFENYAGNAPFGEYALSLFKKIENNLEGPGNLVVNRAIVLDGKNNSVGTLRAFAMQDKYHYIISLDKNQWDVRKIRKEGRKQRYQYGKATLTDYEIELEDSQDKGYLIVCRAIKIDWDYGKQTVIITSLNSNIVGASEVVKAYFDRWPEQELVFRSMKSVACLNRVAGYGKVEEKDRKVVQKQNELQKKISILKENLSGALKDIAREEKFISALIKEEQKLRNLSQIENGHRILRQKDNEYFLEIGRKISFHERQIRKIKKPQIKLFNKLREAEIEWMRLVGKERVYKVDVELDNIMTFYRVSLINFYSFLAYEVYGGAPISMNRLVQAVLNLPALIEETKRRKRVTLEYNRKDPMTMNGLNNFIKKINKLKLKTFNGRNIEFNIGEIDYHLKANNF